MMAGGTVNRYSVYGVDVSSPWPFEFPPLTDAANPIARVEFVQGDDDDFQDPAGGELASAKDEWFVCRLLPDRSAYLRWSGLYEFRIGRGGARIASRPLEGSGLPVLQNFLFAQTLSFALVYQDVEPLHATVVCVDDCAIGFLGDCGFGKSTLLASFVADGFQVLTDDLLVVDLSDDRAIARSGSGRIKLLPDSASAFLGDVSRGVPLHPSTTKRSFPLDERHRHTGGLPLDCLFVLPQPEDRTSTVSIELLPLSRSALMQELLKNSFIVEMLDRRRIAGQFSFAAQLASRIDGVRLSYPAGLHHLPSLRQRIVEHARLLHGRNIQ
ncbi:MAG: hypothetical protein DMF99_07480 [Acidobacteria bacterium]|nr:MAG: hypothetical protein DMF99_07480 [Acidobacteriota bacterium]